MAMNGWVRPAVPTWMTRCAMITMAIVLLGCSGGGGSGAPSAPGITRGLTGSQLALSEGGAAPSVSFVLTGAPTADVVITLSAGASVVVAPTAITFTPGNWHTPQNVTVAAVDDVSVNGMRTDVVTQTVSSADSRYAALTLSDIAVTIADNDAPGVTFQESNGGTQVTEGGSDDRYTVVLNSVPNSDVVITIGGDNQLVASPTTLSFTPFNWNLPQTVTVAAVDDNAAEGAHSGALVPASTSGDAAYNNVTLGAVSVQIIDNDTIATLEFVGDDAIVREGDGRLSVPVRLRLNASVTLASPVSAGVGVLASSTVRNNVDVTPLASGASFPTGSGDGAMGSFLIDIADDVLAEGVETIHLRLMGAGGLGGALGEQVDYRIHLHDNELPRLIASGVTPFGGYGVSNLLGIDPATAVARRLSGRGLAGLSAIGGLAYDATAGVLYAVANGELVKIDVYTGLGSVVGPTVVTAGLAYNASTGVLYGSDGAGLYSIDTATATTTAIGAFGAYTNVEGLAYDGNILYGSDTAANVLLVIDKNTGSATSRGGLGVTGLAGLAFAANTLYAVSTTQDRLYTVNTATGAAAAVGAQPLGFGNVVALSASASAGTLYGFDTGTRQLITIDAASGIGQPYKMTGLGNSFGVQLAGMAYDAIRQVYYGVAANPAGEQYLLHVHTATGLATSIAKITGVSGTLFDLAYDSARATLYGVNGGSLYRIDTASGTATLIGNTGGNPHGLAFDSENNILYASDTNTDQLLTLDTTTGAKTIKGNLGFGNVEGLAYDVNTDTLHGIDTDPLGKNPRLITIHTTSGAGTAVGAVLHEDMSGALAYDSTRAKLYGANKLGLLRLDTTNGRGTGVGQLGVETVTDVAYHPSSGVVYAVASDGDDGKLLTVDLATGSATPVGGLGIACCVDGLTFIGNTLYAVDTSSRALVTVDTTTGAVSNVGVITGYARISGALAYNAVDAKLYGVGGNGAAQVTYELITINPASGTVTASAPIAITGITALAYDPTDDKLYAYDADTARIVTLDPVTGAATVVGDPGYVGIQGLTWR